MKNDDKSYKRDELYSVPDLIARGWTRTTIMNLMDDHDDTRPNPHYKCASPMKFYLKLRVEKIEMQTNDWRAKYRKLARAK